MQRLTGAVQPYAWGSATTIPALLGEEPTDEPQAELWFGTHPAGASTIAGRPLEELVAEEPDRYLGARPLARFGPRLPYLLKVLAAARPLSLQAHPSRAQAEEGYGRETSAGVNPDQRLYSDDWPKPETLCALEDFEALCGFRDPSETYELFGRLGATGALDLMSPLRGGGARELEAVFGRLLRLSDPAAVLAEVLAAAERKGLDEEVSRFVGTAVELAEWFPGDPGVLATLLLNRVALTRNQALYLPTGNLHSYLHGSGIEIMANSDNVLRGGLTSKTVAVDELLSVVDFSPGVPKPLTCVEESAGVWRYPTPAPEFALWRLEVDGRVEVPDVGSGRVLLVVAGAMTTEAGVAARTGAGAGDSLPLKQGQAAFLTADESIALAGEGTAFLAAAGVTVPDRPG
jgi:mannose-6-phosphate isomerase